jgi:hypothetical protein
MLDVLYVGHRIYLGRLLGFALGSLWAHQEDGATLLVSIVDLVGKKLSRESKNMRGGYYHTKQRHGIKREIDSHSQLTYYSLTAIGSDIIAKGSGGGGNRCGDGRTSYACISQQLWSSPIWCNFQVYCHSKDCFIN